MMEMNFDGFLDFTAAAVCGELSILKRGCHSSNDTRWGSSI